MKYFLLYAKGIAMGAADVVPGVSGGTVAFISGIYDGVATFDFEHTGGARPVAARAHCRCLEAANATFSVSVAAGRRGQRAQPCAVDYLPVGRAADPV